MKQFSKTSQGPSMPMFRANYNNEDIIIQEDEIEDGISEQQSRRYARDLRRISDGGSQDMGLLNDQLNTYSAEGLIQ